MYSRAFLLSWSTHAHRWSRTILVSRVSNILLLRINLTVLVFNIILQRQEPQGASSSPESRNQYTGAVCCKGSFSHIFWGEGGRGTPSRGPWGPSYVLTWWNKHSSYIMLQTTHLDPTFLGSGEKEFWSCPPYFPWGPLPLSHLGPYAP